MNAYEENSLRKKELQAKPRPRRGYFVGQAASTFKYQVIRLSRSETKSA